MPDAPAFDFPHDLIEEQHALANLRARYTALCARPPQEAEPQDAAELEELPGALREKAEAVITHPYWGQLTGPDVVKARMALKYAPLPEVIAAGSRAGSAL
ncbi:hypothetical protein [Streptomyces sp. NPDC059063]|uniref:hypothetical protein n=1 Tax=Streptomyces sp. NPDC059063 TaxID=3346712 RepID=UPI0036C1781B